MSHLPATPRRATSCIWQLRLHRVGVRALKESRLAVRNAGLRLTSSPLQQPAGPARRGLATVAKGGNCMGNTKGGTRRCAFPPDPAVLQHFPVPTLFRKPIDLFAVCSKCSLFQVISYEFCKSGLHCYSRACHLWFVLLMR